MKVETGPRGITFAVHEVEKATKLLATCKTHLALKTLLGSEIESCSDYSEDCVDNVRLHPLIAAAHLAFSEHRPLVLSPDMIWIVIVQGAAQHVKNHGERLRHQFVGHEGKLKIRIARTDLHRGSPENDWADVVRDLSLAIRGHLGAKYDQLVADFGTTGPVERTACGIALLDMFRPYFEYAIYCVCGIPEITLEGTEEDWRRLREKVEHLAPYDLDWWLPSVRAICDQFARASAGDIDLSYWKDIYKQQEVYGATIINGWIIKLVPYLKHEYTGNFTHRNPLLDDPGAELTTSVLPSGLSLVPFRCQWVGRAEPDAMEFIGGFVGITQDPTTLALRPKLGWGVRRASGLDQTFAKLTNHQPVPPLENAEFDRHVEALVSKRYCELPGDFLSFYKTCNGIRLFDTDHGLAYRFRAFEAVEFLEAEESQQPVEEYREDTIRINEGGPWLRFCDLSDGTFLALELAHTYEKGWKIIRTSNGAAAQTGTELVVAWSLADLLEQILKSGGSTELSEVEP